MRGGGEVAEARPRERNVDRSRREDLVEEALWKEGREDAQPGSLGGEVRDGGGDGAGEGGEVVMGSVFKVDCRRGRRGESGKELLDGDNSTKELVG